MSIKYLKVKIKSLAEEARIIRLEEHRAKSKKDTFLLNGLKQHRIGIVRYEARHSQLAYAYLRGRQYHQVESICTTDPDWSRVEKLIKKYYGSIDSDHFKEWRTGNVDGMKLVA